MKLFDFCVSRINLILHREEFQACKIKTSFDRQFDCMEKTCIGVDAFCGYLIDFKFQNCDGDACKSELKGHKLGNSNPVKNYCALVKMINNGFHELGKKYAYMYKERMDSDAKFCQVNHPIGFCYNVDNTV